MTTTRRDLLATALTAAAAAVSPIMTTITTPITRPYRPIPPCVPRHWSRFWLPGAWSIAQPSMSWSMSTSIRSGRAMAHG